MIENETHDDVVRKIKLPKVGQTVRSKKYGTLWRVIEKKEIWQHTHDKLHLIPAIYLCYWKTKEGELPGIGTMMGFAYTLHDNTFKANWEIVEER